MNILGECASCDDFLMLKRWVNPLAHSHTAVVPNLCSVEVTLLLSYALLSPKLRFELVSSSVPVLNLWRLRFGSALEIDTVYISVNIVPPSEKTCCYLIAKRYNEYICAYEWAHAQSFWVDFLMERLCLYTCTPSRKMGARFECCSKLLLVLCVVSIAQAARLHYAVNQTKLSKYRKVR